MSKNTDNKQNITRFGEKLRTLRTTHKLTLQSLANLMGLSAHGYISELESGKKPPTVGFVLQLARLFNVTTDGLLKDELELEIESETRTRTNEPMELSVPEPNATYDPSERNSRDSESKC